jgi:hypothetical protein
MPIENVRFVSADKLKTIEDYAASLLSGMISLKTLAGFHLHAESKGLLESDEIETSKTMIWEIRRLLNIYKTQLDSVLERTELTSEAIMKSLEAIVPKAKKTRTRAVKDGN